MATRSKDGRRRRVIRPPASLEIPPPDHLAGLIPVARMPLAHALALCGRSARTGARWRSRGIDDAACLGLLQVHAYGLLPGDRWRDWHVDAAGRLARWVPCQGLPPVTPGELEYVGIAYGIARAAREELAALRGPVGAIRATALTLPAANEPEGQPPRQIALL